MIATTCPNGHPSASTDYCDVCGAPMLAGGVLPGQGGAGAAPGGASAPVSGRASAPVGGGVPSTPAAGTGAAQTCPHCRTENSATALFCEACGYDFTTGTAPRSAPPAGAAGPVAGQAGAQGSGDPSGVGGSAQAAPVAPPVPVEWVVEVWVDPNWHAEQESAEPCPSPGLPVIVPLRVRSVLIGRTSRSRNIHPEVVCDADVAVSRRHAQLSTDGTRWWVEDLGSSNGTFVGTASGPLPSEPLVRGQRRELAEDDRIYIGAWTRLVVRRATDEEKAAG